MDDIEQIVNKSNFSLQVGSCRCRNHWFQTATRSSGAFMAPGALSRHFSALVLFDDAGHGQMGKAVRPSPLEQRLFLVVALFGREDDHFAVGWCCKEFDGHDGFGVFLCGECHPDPVEACDAVAAFDCCGDVVECFRHIVFLSFSMQIFCGPARGRMSGATLSREEWARSAQGKVVLEGTRVPASGPGAGSCIFQKTKGTRYVLPAFDVTSVDGSSAWSQRV